MEEILSEYHQKAFEAEAAQQTGGVAAYSRGAGSSEKTLEEETVDTLNAAGYEAYNVTSENYEALEAQLQTDFADMGLDSDSSYIIVISGEEDSTSKHARGPNPNIGNVEAPDGGGDTLFEHTYNGETYYMRYVTVVATEESRLFRSFEYTLTYDKFPEVWSELLNAGLAFATGAATKVPIGTILSLLMDVHTDSNFRLLNNQQIVVLGNTTWTLKYIQIYNMRDRIWVSAQSTETAESRLFCAGYLYNCTTNQAERFIGDESVLTKKATHYDDQQRHKNDAVRAYLMENGTIARDITGDIAFYLMDDEYEFNYCGEGEPLFTQPHWNM